MGPRELRDKIPSSQTSLNNATPTSSATVRNLGVIFDQDLNFSYHLKNVAKTASFHSQALLRLETPCILRKQKRLPMPLILLGYISATPYYQGAQTLLVGRCNKSK